MINIIVELAKYFIIIFMSVYTVSCFSIFVQKEEKDEKRVLLRQNVLMFVIHFIAYAVIFLKTGDQRVLYFYLAQVVYFIGVIILYNIIYPIRIRWNLIQICIKFIMYSPTFA